MSDVSSTNIPSYQDLLKNRSYSSVRQRIIPGTMIVTKYSNFAGTQENGVFFVLYNEDYDPNTTYKNNLTCCKVTSQIKFVDNYCIPLSTIDVPFLKMNSFAMCSKLHTIFNAEEDIKILGVVSDRVLLKVYKSVKSFLNEVDKQMMNNL